MSKKTIIFVLLITVLCIYFLLMMLSSTLSNRTDTETFVQGEIALDENMAKPKNKTLFRKENKTYDVFKPKVDKVEAETSKKKIKEISRLKDLLI